MQIPRSPPSLPFPPGPDAVSTPLIACVRGIGSSEPTYWFWHYARLFKLLDNGWHISNDRGAWSSAPTPAGGCNVSPVSNPHDLDPFWYANSSVKKAFQEWTYDWQTKLWTLCSEFKAGW